MAAPSVSAEIARKPTRPVNKNQNDPAMSSTATGAATPLSLRHARLMLTATPSTAQTALVSRSPQIKCPAASRKSAAAE